MNTKPLNDRERAFVREYMISRIATDAYVKAGYAAKGSRQNAARLMGNERIVAEIERQETKLRMKHSVTADKTIAALSHIAFTGLSKFLTINADGQPEFDFSNCTADDLNLLSEITTESWVEGKGDAARTVRRVKIKAYSRLDAVKVLMQHFGLLSGKGPTVTVDPFQRMMDELQKRRSMLPTLPTGPLGYKTRPN